MPSLGELLSRFLQQQTAAHAAGVASPESGEVTPFEAGMVQPVEPRLAWKEATAAHAPCLICNSAGLMQCMVERVQSPAFKGRSAGGC